MDELLELLRDALAEYAEDADRSGEWPAASWDALRRSGLLGWGVSPEYGGAKRDAVALLRRAEALAATCLTTAFILSQREAAVRHVERGPEPLRRRYLPGLAAGTAFLTVGLSQLTTSRQHQQPALRATPDGATGFRLDGEVPWVTAADQAVALVLGATLPDDRQALVVIPTDRRGLAVEPPLPLSALAGSRTALVRCDEVPVTVEDLLAEPAPRILGAVGGGGLETSALALGLARAAADYLRQEAVRREALIAPAQRLHAGLAAARGRLHEQASVADADATLAVRVECTRLALAASQAALLAAKGTGFVRPHPAQRWVRQAAFFLVWSCPRPVSEGVLAGLLPS